MHLSSTALLHRIKKCYYERYTMQSKFLLQHHVPKDTIPGNSCVYDVCLIKEIRSVYKGALPIQPV